MSCHVDPELISLLTEDELPPDQAREIEAHIAECDECREIHARLVAFAELFRAAQRPVEVAPDFAARTMRTLAAERGARTRPPRRRRLLVLGSFAVVAAAAMLLLFVGGSSTIVGRAEGLLMQLEDDDWVLRGSDAPIEIGRAYAAPAEPVEMALDGGRLWMDRGTIVAVEEASPLRVRVLAGAARAMNSGEARIRVVTPAGEVTVPPEGEVAVFTGTPEDLEVLRESLRDVGRRGASLATIFVPDASAATASSSRRVVIACLRGRIGLPDGDTLESGLEQVRGAADETVLEAPCDTVAIRRSLVRREDESTLLLTRADIGRTALDIAEQAFGSEDEEARDEIERLLVELTPALTDSEHRRIERWIGGDEDHRVALAARMIARRGRISVAARRTLETLALDSERSHLKRAAAVAVLASVDEVGSSKTTLVELTAPTELPDLRLTATWGLLAARETSGREALLSLLGDGDAAVAGAAARSVTINSDVLTDDDWRHLLESAHARVREHAALHLGFLGTREDLPRLEALLVQSRQPTIVRMRAAYSAVRLSAPEDRPRLARMAAELPPELARVLALELSYVASDPEVMAAVIVAAPPADAARFGVLTTLAPRYPEAQRALIAMFDDLSDAQLVAAAQRIGPELAESSHEALDEMLGRTEIGSDRWHAIVEGLAGRSLRTEVDRVLAHLETRPNSLRRDRSVRLLTRLSHRIEDADLGDSVARALRRSLSTAEPELGGQICRALGHVGRAPMAVPALVERLRNDPRSSVRLAAAMALERRPGDAAADALSDIALTEDGQLAIAALRALAGMGRCPAAVGQLENSEDAVVRLWALTARIAANPDRVERAYAAAFRALDRRHLLDYVRTVRPLAMSNAAFCRIVRDLCLRHPSPRIRVEAARFSPLQGADDSVPVRQRFGRDAYWFVRVAGKCYGGGARNEIALTLTDAPGHLPNTFRRKLMRFLPVEGWFPEALTASRVDGGDTREAEVALRTLKVLVQIIGKDGAGLDDRSGFLGSRRAAGFARSVRLSDSLVQATGTRAVARFYQKYSGSID